MTVIQSRGFWLLSDLSNAAFPIFTTTGQHAQRSITHTQRFSWYPIRISPGTTCSCCLSSQPWVPPGKDRLPAPLSCCKGWQSIPQSSLLKTEQTQFSASTQRLFASPSEHLSIPFQYFSVRFYSSSDNRDSSPQGRTYTAKRLPKTVFCC